VKKSKQSYSTTEPSEYKTVPAFVKLVAEGDEGVVEHLISVFGVLDLGGDVTHPGSFTKTLSEQDGRIKVLDSHQRASALDAIGYPLKIWEVSREGLPPAVLSRYPEATGGVMARTQFLMDTPEGRGVFTRIKSGAVSEFSFAYDPLDADYSEVKVGDESVTVRNLRTVRLYEYSPVVFGMNPAAAVVSAKGAGEEEKPAPDVTENTIRIRVRNPSSFQEGSFRTINIGDKGNGIQAVIGRLKGETTTTIQSYIFDKSKWTVERAREWVKEHGKKALSYTRVIDQVRAAFNSAYNNDLRDESSHYWVHEVFDTFLVVRSYQDRFGFFKVGFDLKDGEVEFTPRGEWASGEYVFVERGVDTDNKEAPIDCLAALVSIEQELIEIVQISNEAGPARTTHLD